MKKLAVIAALLFFVPILSTHAASPEVAGWVPWFADEEGIERVSERVTELDTLYLFAYEAVRDHILIERADLNDGAWEELIDTARSAGVEIIPTVSWFIGEAIHETLSDPRLRERHIERLIELVEDGDYDGIDIDYEQKRAETIDYFSDFLKELSDALGDKALVCSIEARTPPDSVYRDVPDEIEYANDFEAIGRYCDRVQIMAYDQQRIDWQLNTERQGLPYAPVADAAWVEKTLKLALEDIDADKIMLGVPTYGRAWDVTVSPMWYQDYASVASLNQPRILELSEKYDAPIGRTLGGEAAISYFPEDSVFSVLDQLPVLPGTPRGYEAAIKALLFATLTNLEVSVRFVSWSDAEAIADKLELAEQYGLRGISIFKIDGEEDQGIWELL